MKNNTKEHKPHLYTVKKTGVTLTGNIYNEYRSFD